MFSPLFETCVEKPSNGMLWILRPYIFRRLRGIGDILVHDHVEFRVLRCHLTNDHIWTEIQRTGKTTYVS